MEKPPTKIAKVKLGMTLFLRCVGAIIVLEGLMGYVSYALAIGTLSKNDASLTYVNGQIIGSSTYLIFGILLIVSSKSLVSLMASGLKESDF